MSKILKRHSFFWDGGSIVQSTAKSPPQLPSPPPPSSARCNIRMKTLKHQKRDIATRPTNYCNNKL